MADTAAAGQAASCAKRVYVTRVVTQVARAGGDRRIGRGGLRCSHVHAQLVQQVVGAFHQFRSLLDQRVQPFAMRRMYRTLEWRTLAPLLGGEAGGDQRARGERRFHDQATRAQGPSMTRLRRGKLAPCGGVRAKFAQDQAPRARCARPGRGCAVDRGCRHGAEDRNGGSGRVQSRRGALRRRCPARGR